MVGPRRHLTLGHIGTFTVAAVVAAVLPASASAHSFLIRSQPEAGARLAKAPPTMTLYYSEPFVRGSQQVSIRRATGEAVKLPPSKGAGAVIDQPLPTNLRGVFVVSWRVLSDDGHTSLGEFAFAVGSAAALPTVRNSVQTTAWSEVAASWLVFIGLALTLGGLVSERFVWRRTPAKRTVAAAPVVPGVILAMAGGLLGLVLLAGNQRGGGFSAGLHRGAIADALGERPGKLTLALLLALAVAGALVLLRWLRVSAILPLLAAVGFIAARGHSGTSGAGWAVVADAVHLAAVAAWFGALAHLVLIVARAEEPRPALAEGVYRYSRFALPTVLVLLATGVMTAIPEFRSVGVVLSSGYGRTLLIKSGLIGVALLLALTARLRALPANPHLRLPLLRRLTLAESTTVLAVLVAAAVLVNTAPPRAPAAPQASTAVLGPPPVSGPALRLADLAGQLVVGLAATERELQFTIIPPSGQPKESVKLTAEGVEPGGRALDLFPRPCGPECFTIRHRLKPGPTVITAHVKSGVWKGGDARFVVPWPLGPARPSLLARIAAMMRRLPSLRLTEAVSSGPGSSTGPSGYRLSGRQFMQTEVFGGGAADVRVLGRQDGLTELAFAIPGSNIWYRMSIDRRYRLRRELILDPGHLIRRTFSYGAASASPSSPGATLASPALIGAVSPPPPGALALGREDGDLAVLLFVLSRNGRVTLQTTVLGPQGGGLSGLTVSYSALIGGKARTAATGPCGDGCYRATLPSSSMPTSVAVVVSGAGRPRSSATFALPAYWPPPTADALVRRATHVFRNLRTLVIHERLGSSPTAVLTTLWTIEAPDRLRYQIQGGAEAIIIGSRRWDRDPGGTWKESPQSPIHQPTPAWVTDEDAHIIGTIRVGGRAAWLVSFYDRKTPAVFVIAVDKTTRRTLALHMTAAAHFMHHLYSGFNAPLTIAPPQ